MPHAKPNEAGFPIHRTRPLILAPILAIAALAHGASAQQTAGPRPAEMVAHDATQTELAGADAGYQAFLAKTPGPWRALYDEDWGRPISIVGKGIPTTTGPIATTEQARSIAEAVLAQYPELWRLPVSQLRLTNETKAGRLFVFTWQQEFDGLEVRRARVRIQVHEAGRVASISATTTPIPEGFSRDAKITAEGARAIVALGKELLASDSVLTNDLLVFVDAKGGICTPRLAWQVAVEQPSRQVHERVFVDANDGRVLLVEPTQLDFAPQQVQGNVTALAKNALDPVSTATVPLQGARVTIQNQIFPFQTVQTFTDVNGNYSTFLFPNNNWNATVDLVGPVYQVKPVLGIPYTKTQNFSGQFGNMSLTPNFGDLDTDQFTVAHLFEQIQDYAEARIGGFGGVSGIILGVNYLFGCNAYGGKSQLSFTLKIGSCADSTYSTVVYHEYGHAVDDTYGGMLDGALSEALGDIFAMYKTGQPVLGQDFSGPGTQVRNGVNGVTWPASGCGGEVHCVGETFMGFAWLARQNLINTYGAGAGTAIAEYDFLNTLPANNTGILDAVDQVFLLDDDDGDLSNGTPHYVPLYNAALAKKFKSPGPVLDSKQWVPQPVFPPGGPLPVPPKGLVLADVNGDGKLDFLGNGTTGSIIVVCFGDGSGGWGAPVAIPVLGSPSAIAIGDWNHDSKLDVAYANGQGDTIGILLGNGAGGFVPAGSSPGGFHPSHLVAADINNDGMMDLVGTNMAQVNSLTVWLGIPSGSFSAPVFYTGTTAPSGLDVRDLNGDGHPDVVIASPSPASGGGTIQVMLGGAPGGLLGSPSSFPTADPPGEIAIGDFDHDGHRDVAAASPSAGTISLLPGDGLGNLGTSKSIALDLHQPQYLAFGDTGGDGAEDLLGTEAGDPGSGAGNLLLLSGGVVGPECAPQRFPAGAQPFGLAIGDTNQDGRPDVIVANQGSGNVSGFLNGLADAVPGSATPVGKGTPGCSGTLALCAPLDPKIGETGFEILCSNAPANALGLGIITNVADPVGSDALGLGVKFHVDLFNSTELYSADFLSDGSGQGRAALPIPNNPFIVGHAYTAQVFWVEPGGKSCGPSIYHLVSSEGLTLVLLQP